MKLVPIIEVQNGNTIFGLPQREGLSARIKNPVLHARYWMDQGANSIFFKDHDGSIIGKPQNYRFLEYLDNQTTQQIYYCGGIRDLRSVRIFEQRKYAKMVSATALIENKKFLRNILANKIGSIALWIDSIDGFIYTRNASHRVGKRTLDIIRMLPEFGIDEIFFCVRNDKGILTTPDYDMIFNFLDLGCKNLYIAENVTTRNDFEKLMNYQNDGLAGIAGSNLFYDNILSINEMRALFNAEERFI
ncbi:MAG: HisA/HisF-related TIM barrel protein [Brevinemataceae bacterium]